MRSALHHHAILVIVCYDRRPAQEGGTEEARVRAAPSAVRGRADGGAGAAAVPVLPDEPGVGVAVPARLAHKVRPAGARRGVADADRARDPVDAALPADGSSWR